MANYTPEVMDFDGLDPTYNPADAGGDEFVNDGRIFCHIVNGGASPVTVTADSKQLSNQGYDNDEAVTVPAGESRLWGVFRPSRFNNQNGRVELSYDQVTNVTIAFVEARQTL